MTQTSYELRTASGAYRGGRIAFIKAGWHSNVVDRALEGFIAGMSQAPLESRAQGIQRGLLVQAPAASLAAPCAASR